MTAVRANREDTSQRALGQRRSAWPRAIVAATVAWNLWQDRAALTPAHSPSGPGAAVRWSLYLLWCLWPAAIYACARLLGLRPQTAACAAVAVPLLHSAPGIGTALSTALNHEQVRTIGVQLAEISLAGLGTAAVATRLAAAASRFFELEPVRPGQHYPPVRPPGQPVPGQSAASQPHPNGEQPTDA